MPLRLKTPARSQVEEKANYRGYKEDLREDFATRCGYCDALDEFFGGIRGYQIDHFAPQFQFPEWRTHYGNLVYSCPICNRAKSNKWIGDDKSIPNNGNEGFVDPCDPDYENHLDRDQHGRFLAKTVLGQYMIENLNLSLIRHQFIWQSQMLDKLLGELLEIEELLSGDTERYRMVSEEIIRVVRAHREYRRRAIEA